MFLSLFEFYTLAFIFAFLAFISPIVLLAWSPYKLHIWNVFVFAACGTPGFLIGLFVFSDAIDHFGFLHNVRGYITFFGISCGLVASTYLGLRFFGIRTDGYQPLKVLMIKLKKIHWDLVAEDLSSPKQSLENQSQASTYGQQRTPNGRYYIIRSTTF